MSVQTESAQAKTPKARLIELLTQPEAHEQLLQITRAVGDGPHALIRAALMLAGFRVPEENADHAQFVASLLHSGFYVVPGFLGVPELGDLYVGVDGRIEPAELGFVVKFNTADLSPQGRLKQRPEWFMALPARIPAEGRPLNRRPVLADERPIGFWLRLHGGG